MFIVGCGCKVETANIEPIRKEKGDDVIAAECSQNPTPPVHVITDGAAAQCKRAGAPDTAVTVPPVSIPGRSSNQAGQYSDTSADRSADTNRSSLNLTLDNSNQSYRKPRSIQTSWSKKIFKTMLTLVLLLMTFMKVEGNAEWRESPFLIQSYDCTIPGVINKLPLPESCFIPEKKLPEKLTVPQPAWILGEEYVHEISGVVCSATISRFRGYCGAYSHWKFMDVPEIEADEPVTLEQCMSASKGWYNSPDGEKVKIAPGETILYQYIEDGSITVHPTNTYCQGVSLPLHRGTVADQSLILTQIRFSMIREVYLRTRDGKTAAKFSRVSLPSSCSKKWCLDGSRVYLMIKLKVVLSRESVPSA